MLLCAPFPCQNNTNRCRLQALLSLRGRLQTTVTALHLAGVEGCLPAVQLSKAVDLPAKQEAEPVALNVNFGREGSEPEVRGSLAVLTIQSSFEHCALNWGQETHCPLQVSMVLLNTYVGQAQEIPVANAVLKLIAAGGHQRRLTLAGAVRMPSQRGTTVMACAMHRPMPAAFEACEQLSGSTSLQDGFFAALIHLANVRRIPTVIALIPGMQNCFLALTSNQAPPCLPESLSEGSLFRLSAIFRKKDGCRC